MAQYEPPAPPICLRGALKSCLGVYDYGGFEICWSLRSKMSRSTAISFTQQLKSQLAPGPAAGHAPALVPYIVRDGQWQCGIRPTAPSMAHPARKDGPNGPVGRKLQHFKYVHTQEREPRAAEPVPVPMTMTRIYTGSSGSTHHCQRK